MIHEINREERPKSSYRGFFRLCADADLALLLPAVAVSIASGLITPAFTILSGKTVTSFGSFSTGQTSPNDLDRQVTIFVAGICVIGAPAWVLGWQSNTFSCLRIGVELAFEQNLTHYLSPRPVERSHDPEIGEVEHLKVDLGIDVPLISLQTSRG